jgi:hypothetical protein
MVPLGINNVETLIGGATLIDNSCGEDILPTESCTVTLKVYRRPDAETGVPLMPPLEALNVNPGGRDPLTIIQLLYGGIPPAATSDGTK